MLTIMLWILPINLPVLVVWIRNLAVQWFTPFSSHHNILSIMPYIILVETLSTGRMIPRVKAPPRTISSILLFALALCAAVYGVSYAYYLHHVVNVFCGWLVLLHWSGRIFPYYRIDGDSEAPQSTPPTLKLDEKTPVVTPPPPPPETSRARTTKGKKR
jgi:hypothetical protein